jgi:hypothetical protein
MRLLRGLMGCSLEIGLSQRNLAHELPRNVPRRFPSHLWRESIQDAPRMVDGGTKACDRLVGITRRVERPLRELELFNHLCGFLQIDRHTPLLSPLTPRGSHNGLATLLPSGSAWA